MLCQRVGLIALAWHIPEMDEVLRGGPQRAEDLPAELWPSGVSEVGGLAGAEVGGQAVIVPASMLMIAVVVGLTAGGFVPPDVEVPAVRGVKHSRRRQYALQPGSCCRILAWHPCGLF